MRQLDLFGSFFETPQTNKAEESTGVLKKEQEKFFVAEPETPYSKNTLRSEKPGTADVDITGKTAEAEEQKQETGTAITAPAPLLLSLFDKFFSEEKIEPFEQQPEVNVSETQPEILIPEAVEEPINTTALIAPAIVNEPEVPVVEVQLEIAATHSAAEPAAEMKKKPEAPKQKNPKAPELERNGSVVFDDGKISVKIKNKNPFPPPVIKEKKVKVKKIPQKRGRKSFKEIDAEVDLIEIPEDEVLFEKQYYGISEVAKWFRVNTSLLRFWENEFDVLKPRKNRKGDRLFRPEDVKNLQLIYQLLRQRKYTIEGAKEYIKTNKKKADVQLQLTTTLQKFKSFLLDMKANLQP